MDLAIFFIIFAGFYFFGERVCRLWRPVFAGPMEACVFCVALGLVGVSLATTALAFLGLIYPITGWVALGLIFLVCGQSVVQRLRALMQFCGSFRSRRLGETKPGDWFAVFNLGVVCVLLFMALALAQAPPVRVDSLVYHLAIPKAYLENHGIVNLPNNMYSFFPLMLEMLFLFCMTFGREALPQLAGLGMTLVLLAAMTLFVKRHFSTRYLALTPVLFLSVPTFFEVSVTAYIDVAVGGFIFLSYYSWDRWRDSKQEAWFWFMLVFAASAWAAKLTAFIVLPLVFLAIALAGKDRDDSVWAVKKLLIFAGVFFLFILPWWAKNYHFSGNPFAPLFMQALGGADRINWDPERAYLMDAYVKNFGMGRGFADLLKLPFNLTFFSAKNSYKFDGQIGVLYLALLPGLAWVWRKRPSVTGPLFIVFSVLMIFWFIYFQYARFLALAFPFLTILCVYGLELMTGNPSAHSDRPAPVWRQGFLILLAGATLFNLSIIAKEWNRLAPLNFLAGLESRDQYLERHLPPYPVYRAMDEKLPADAKVLFVYARNYGYLAARDFIGDSVFEAHTLQKIMQNDNSIEGVLRQFKDLGVTHLMFDNNFVFGEDAAFPPDQQAVLKETLNSRARLIENKNGFYLYGFMVD